MSVLLARSSFVRSVSFASRYAGAFASRAAHTHATPKQKQSTAMFALTSTLGLSLFGLQQYQGHAARSETTVEIDLKTGKVEVFTAAVAQADLKGIEFPDLRTGDVAVEGRKSFALPSALFADTSELYETVIQKVADNRKIGPFVATSGKVLDYYLNLSTNFLDHDIAEPIVRLMVRTLQQVVLPRMKSNSTVVMAGPEMAGGVLAGQLSSDPIGKTLDIDYVYVRKNRKTSGTLQQLEGPTHITRRTPTSPSVDCILVDDCISTGSSAVQMIASLKAEYNINVTAMLFLVDRHHDRRKMSDEELRRKFEPFRDIDIYAIYDLDDVEACVNRSKK